MKGRLASTPRWPKRRDQTQRLIPLACSLRYFLALELDGFAPAVPFAFKFAGVI